MKNTLLSLLLISALTVPAIAQRPDYASGQNQSYGSYNDQGYQDNQNYQGHQGYDDSRNPGYGQSDDRTRGVVVSPRPDYDYGQFDVNVYTDKRTYYYGQNVRVSFKATRDSYVYVFSTDPNGERRQIFPNYYERDNRVSAGRTYTIPSRSYSLRATPPSGNETISVVAVRERFRDMNRYTDYTKSNPFPKSYGASRLKTRIEPHGRRGSFYAEDSTTIRIRRPER